MRKRTQAREITLQALYQFDLHRQIDPTGQFGVDDYEDFIQTSATDPEVREYARRLLSGVLASVDKLDEKIAAVSENWRLNRTAAIDRCALRIGLYELLETPEIPPKVAINEAIELVKKFSAEQSSAFVNGILDRIYTELRDGRAAVENRAVESQDPVEKEGLGETSELAPRT